MRKFFLFSIIPLLAACGGSETFSPAEEAGMQLATQVSIFESKDNQKQWILHADAVDFSDLKSATLKKPVLLLKENGRDSVQVTGETGSFDYPSKLVSIEGHAIIKSLTEKATITAEQFSYDVDKNRIWSDTKTVITRGGAKVTAKGGVETDSKLSKIELKKQTTRLPVRTDELKLNKETLHK